MQTKPTALNAPNFKPTIVGAQTSTDYRYASGTVPWLDALSDNAFVREAQLVPSPKRPGVSAPLPFSAPTLWRKVKAGTFPAPCRLSERVTAWRVGDIRAWINAQTAG